MLLSARLNGRFVSGGHGGPVGSGAGQRAAACHNVCEHTAQDRGTMRRGELGWCSVTSFSFCSGVFFNLSSFCQIQREVKPFEAELSLSLYSGQLIKFNSLK